MMKSLHQNSTHTAKMMNKPIIAIITDLHFGVSNFNKPLFEEQMKFFEQEFFPYLLKNNIEEVFCCGDFFHTRDKIDWYILDEIKERFFEWFETNQINFRVLVGNHDTYYRHTLKVNSLTKTARGFRYIKVYDDESIVTVGKYTFGFIPWIVDMKTYEFPERCDILFAHLELKDFPMMKGICSHSGYDHSIFENYKYVFSGHYHVNSVRDNVIMVGTPYQLTWNDFNSQKGFYVLDDSFNYEYIQNTINPKFVKLFLDNDSVRVEGLGGEFTITKAESIDIAKENYCRIYVVKSDDALELELYHNSLLQVSCNNYKIDVVHLADVVENFDSDSFDEKFENEESTIDLVVSCIQGMTFESGIDHSKLIRMAQEEYKKALDEAYSTGEE